VQVQELRNKGTNSASSSLNVEYTFYLVLLRPNQSVYSTKFYERDVISSK